MRSFKKTLIPVAIEKTQPFFVTIAYRVKKLFTENNLLLIIFWLFILRGWYEMSQTFPPLKYVFAVMLIAFITAMSLALTLGTIIVVTEHRKRKIIDARRFWIV